MHRWLVPVLALTMAGPLAAAERTVTVDGPGAVGRDEAAARLRGTPLRWAAGTVSLAEALERLAVEGNRAVVGEGLDPTSVRTLPALDGLWWDGVLLVARTWDADLLPAEGVDGGTSEWVELADGSGAPAWRLGATWAPPVLAPGRPLLRAQAGPCLVEWPEPELDERDGGPVLVGSVTARLEPRFARSGNGSAHLLTAADEDGRGATPDGGLPLGAEGQLRAIIALRLSNPWSASAALMPGDRLRLVLADGPVTVERTDAGVVVAIAGDRGRPRPFEQMEFGSEDEPLRPESSRRQHGKEGSQTTLTFTDLPAGPLTVRLRGEQPAGTLDLPLSNPDLALLPDQPAGPSSTRGHHAPTRLTWTGGPRSLAAAVAALQAGGNRLVLPFGSAGDAVRDLPAYEGSWWGGVLLVARTWGYAVHPAAGPDQAASLRPGNAAGSPAGAWLVQVAGIQRRTVRTATGLDRRAEVRLRIIPEPRLAGTPPAAEIVWASEAALDGGLQAAIAEVDTGDEDDTGTTLGCELRHLPDGPGIASLAGLLRVGISDPVAVETAIAPGRTRRIRAGGADWLLSLAEVAVADQGADGHRTPTARLRITGPGDLAQSIDPAITDATGTPCPDVDRSTDGGTLVLDVAMPPPGPLTVRFTAEIDHGIVAVPFTLALPLP
jgi:hypothetical protein